MCRDLQDAEPGWNEQVYSRVIELALEGQTAVAFQNMYASSYHALALLTSHTSCVPRFEIAHLTNK